jgi:ABC-type transport system involved in cytochrome c biogenesis permease subunit
MIRTFLCIVTALLASACSTDRGLDPAHRTRLAPWDPAVVDAFARLPVQDGGRVKPLSTVAQYALLAMNGNRELSVTWGDQKKEHLVATEWLLDCFFHPEQARHYRCLRVDDAAAIAAIGLRFPERKRLDRYSYAEIAPAQDKLMALARQYGPIDAKKRTPVQGQIVDLAGGMVQLDRMLASMDFARQPIEVGRTEALRKAFPGEPRRPVSFVLGSLERLALMARELGRAEGIEAAVKDAEQAAILGILGDFERAIGSAGTLALFPPSARDGKTWRTLPELANDVLTGDPLPPACVQLVERCEQIAAKRGDAAEVRTLAAAALADMRALTEARGEYAKVGIEVAYYRGDFVYRALLVCGFAFVLAAISWLVPRSRLLARGVPVAVLSGLALLVVGIVLRCIIMSRPPVATLYETFLLITAVGALVGLVAEWFNRQRVGIAVAAFLGFAGLFLARRFEELEAQDTLRMLPAVLNTNFWLSTHVTTITMGYSAGLVAALFAHVWIFAKLLLPGRVQLHRTVARMIYGTVCFTLLFSVVGTILGGIWANDSWGRFWGWDPKENGALLICLANIATLHARLAGWLRDRGLALAAIAGGVVVAFSWFHVNQLGVGLHSYGFTQGILTALTVFYVSQLAVFLLGLMMPDRTPPAVPVAAPPPPVAQVEPVGAK